LLLCCFVDALRDPEKDARVPRIIQLKIIDDWKMSPRRNNSSFLRRNASN
jgi:hypothetical protein